MSVVVKLGLTGMFLLVTGRLTPLSQRQVPVQQNKATPEFGEHTLERIENNKKIRCAFCQANKNTTKSGWDLFTKFRCSKCMVPLCTLVLGGKRNKRNCFDIYHRQLLGLPMVTTQPWQPRIGPR